MAKPIMRRRDQQFRWQFPGMPAFTHFLDFWRKKVAIGGTHHLCRQVIAFFFFPASFALRKLRPRGARTHQ